MKHNPNQTVLPVSFGSGPRDVTPETVIHIIQPRRDGSVDITILPADGPASEQRLNAVDAAIISAILNRASTAKAKPERAILCRECNIPG